MREDRSKQTTKNVFYLYSYGMMIYGLWPLSDNTPFLKFRVAFAVVQMIFAVISTMIKFLIQCGNSEDLVDTFFFFVIYFLVMAKCILLYLHREKLASVIHSASEDWEIMGNERYRKKMLKNANFCDAVTKCFYSMSSIVLIVYVLKVMVFDVVHVTYDDAVNGTSVGQQRGYLFPYGCIFDDFGNPVYYFIVFNQAIQVSVSCCMSLAGDALYVAITLHLCGQCEIMKLAFRRFGEYDSLEKNNYHLKVLIARHQNLMRRAEKLEDVYNEIIFLQMLLSILLLSVGGFSFLIDLNNGYIPGVAKDIVVMQFMLVQTYIYSFPADDLKDQAEGLLHALYSSQWCNMPAYIMKDIVFMMMRINVPPHYTAGKFFYVTRESYMIVIKTAASFLSVLRLMIE